MAFDQQRKPPLLFSIDPEGDSEVKKRRPATPSCFFEADEREEADDCIRPGMLVIIEPHASEQLAEKATAYLDMKIIHLHLWKQKLREKLRELKDAGKSVRFALRNTNLVGDYVNIESTVHYWSQRRGEAAQAPQSYENFRQLVSEFLQYDAWEAPGTRFSNFVECGEASALIAKATLKNTWPIRFRNISTRFWDRTL